MRDIFARCAVLFMLFQGMAMTEEVDRFAEFQKDSVIARELWQVIHKAFIAGETHAMDAEVIGQIAGTYQRLETVEPANSLQNEVLEFLRTTATSVLKQDASERADCFRKITGKVMVVTQLRMGTPGKYLVPRTNQSSIIPISGEQWRLEPPPFLGRSGYLPQPPRYYPYVQHDKPCNIGCLFDELERYDEAWKAYCEEEYLFSQKNWHDAAKSAYRAGECYLAWGFLMKAAVFGDEKLYANTLKTAKFWIDVESGKAELPKPVPLTPQERKVKFKEIVLAYKNMNAHPRAWAVIDEYKEEFDDSEGLKKEIQDDWIKLTDMLCSPSIANRVILYGYELMRVEMTEADELIENMFNFGTRTVVYPHKPLDVKIPWIYPEGWQENAQKMLDEEMEKLDVAPVRLRTWHTNGGAVSFVAKFISLTDDKVTLEKEDKTTVTFAIGELMAGDQNFVRYCFGTKTDK